MKTRNKIIIAVSAVLVAFLAVYLIVRTVNSGGTAGVSYPDGYTVITGSNIESNSDFIEKLGYSTESFSNRLSQKNIISFAANSDNSMQYTLSENTSDLTKEVADLSLLTNKEIRVVSKKLLKNGSDTSFRFGDYVFLESLTKQTDKETYYTLQLITVKGGKSYTLNCFVASRLTDEMQNEIKNVAKSLTVPNDKTIDFGGKTGGITFYTVLLGAIVLAGVAAIILLSISLINDIKSYRANSSSENIKIKRRRK